MCRAREKALNAILNTTPQSPENILMEPVAEIPAEPPEEPLQVQPLQDRCTIEKFVIGEYDGKSNVGQIIDIYSDELKINCRNLGINLCGRRNLTIHRRPLCHI